MREVWGYCCRPAGWLAEKGERASAFLLNFLLSPTLQGFCLQDRLLAPRPGTLKSSRQQGQWQWQWQWQWRSQKMSRPRTALAGRPQAEKAPLGLPSRGSRPSGRGLALGTSMRGSHFMAQGDRYTGSCQAAGRCWDTSHCRCREVPTRCQPSHAALQRVSRNHATSPCVVAYVRALPARKNSPQGQACGAQHREVQAAQPP